MTIFFRSCLWFTQILNDETRRNEEEEKASKWKKTKLFFFFYFECGKEWVFPMFFSFPASSAPFPMFHCREDASHFFYFCRHVDLTKVNLESLRRLENDEKKRIFSSKEVPNQQTFVRVELFCVLKSQNRQSDSDEKSWPFKREEHCDDKMKVNLICPISSFFLAFFDEKKSAGHHKILLSSFISRLLKIYQKSCILFLVSPEGSEFTFLSTLSTYSTIKHPQDTSKSPIYSNFFLTVMVIITIFHFSHRFLDSHEFEFQNNELSRVKKLKSFNIISASNNNLSCLMSLHARHFE